MAEQISYERPEPNEEKDFHSISLELDGLEIGCAKLEYHSRPFPYYLLFDLDVSEEFQGKGYGSKLMDKVEAFLLQKRKAGVVADAIDIDSPAAGMYERRGWQLIPGETSAYAFNVPESADMAQLHGYFRRYQNFKL